MPNTGLKWSGIAVFICLAILPGIEARASTGPVVSYRPDFYVLQEPVTAADILDVIPGARPILSKVGGGGRGLNNNAQLVLLNGKPISAKRNDVKDVLQRIPASSVQRVDLIQGGLPGQDVADSDTVVNLVLATDGEKTANWQVSRNNFESGESSAGEFFLGFRDDPRHTFAGQTT